MKAIRSNQFSLSLLIALGGVSVYFYPQLPAAIPTKFDFQGNPTQISSREFVVAFMPAIYLALMVMVRWMVRLSPEKFAMPNSRRAIDTIIAGCGLLFLGIHFGMVLEPGNKDTFARCFSLGVALFLVVAGNVFGKTERNFFMGVRVPWTLATEGNWRATHRFTGRMMVGFGLTLLVLSVFYASMPVTIIAVLIPTLSPVAFSYLYYRRNEMQQTG
jgi:uncharacterized membrane protein